MGLRRLFDRARQQKQISLGDLGTLTPISNVFGYDRGTPIRRYYIEKFLNKYVDDIRGQVLEIGGASYTQRFGGKNVSRSDVLHVAQGNPEATLVGNLETGEGVPENSWDCIILVQTLHCIFDMEKALRTVKRALKMDGTVLATLPGISQISRYDMDRWGDYWRLTSLSARRLFEAVFSEAAVTVETYGNVLTAITALHGLAAEELRKDQLDYVDPDYQVLLAARAVKKSLSE